MKLVWEKEKYKSEIVKEREIGRGKERIRVEKCACVWDGGRDRWLKIKVGLKERKRKWEI